MDSWGKLGPFGLYVLFERSRSDFGLHDFDGVLDCGRPQVVPAVVCACSTESTYPYGHPTVLDDVYVHIHVGECLRLNGGVFPGSLVAQPCQRLPGRYGSVDDVGGVEVQGRVFVVTVVEDVWFLIVGFVPRLELRKGFVGCGSSVGASVLEGVHASPEGIDVGSPKVFEERLLDCQLEFRCHWQNRLWNFREVFVEDGSDQYLLVGHVHVCASVSSCQQEVHSRESLEDVEEESPRDRASSQGQERA